MYTTDILMKEHEEISVFVDRLEKEAIFVMNGGKVDDDFFRKAIVFIRKFADDTHHKKEEDILFKYMMENLGPVAEKLIRQGMMMEHQMAGYHVLQLEENLNRYEEDSSDFAKVQIIAHAMGYVNLLRSHIEKENTAVYPFGEKQLPEDVKEVIDREMAVKREAEREFVDEKEELLRELLN